MLTVRNYIACMTKLFQNTIVDKVGGKGAMAEGGGRCVCFMGTALINEPRVES